jgi:hypothetical protein
MFPKWCDQTRIETMMAAFDHLRRKSAEAVPWERREKPLSPRASLLVIAGGSLASWVIVIWVAVEVFKLAK